MLLQGFIYALPAQLQVTIEQIAANQYQLPLAAIK